ncbi:hypothetical protein LAV79_12525 [Peribacillus butanolivorans]|uniref:hypothetical protein n=1 Tax=Peribacillus butanolivorans TaxID=421767 RepID=UPI0030C9EFA8
MPSKETTQKKRLEDHIRMQALKRKLKNNPKWRKQKGVVIAEYNGDEVAVRVLDSFDTHVLTEEDFNKQEEAKEMPPANPEKEVKEKLDILNEILNLGKKVSKESYKEFYEIGERRDEDWESKH